MDSTTPPPYPQGLPPPQQIVVHVHQNPTRMTDNRVYPDYKGRTSMILGSGQIFCAVTAIVCNAVGMDDESDFNACIGIWASPLFLACGSMAIKAAKNKSHQKLQAVTGLAITSAILGIVLFGWSFSLISGHDSYEQILGMLMMAAGLAEAILSFWLCSLSGGLVFECSNTPVYVQMPTTHGQSYVLSGPQTQTGNGVLQGNNLVGCGTHQNWPIAQTGVFMMPQGQGVDTPRYQRTMPNA